MGGVSILISKGVKELEIRLTMLIAFNNCSTNASHHLEAHGIHLLVGALNLALSQTKIDSAQHGTFYTFQECILQLKIFFSFVSLFKTQMGSLTHCKIVLFSYQFSALKCISVFDP